MSGRGPVPVVSFVGKSGVGKTTALEKVIRELKQRGHRVGTIKHDAHGFDIDRPGKDSWRHGQAGSDAVAIASPRQMAVIRKLDREMTVDEIVPLLGDVELVITEGYKRGDKPKIEVSRKAHGSELLCTAEELVAIMADYPLAMEVPQFGLDDAEGVAALLERLYLEHVEVKDNDPHHL